MEGKWTLNIDDLEKKIAETKIIAANREDAATIIVVRELIKIVRALQQENWELKVELNKNA